MHRRWILALWAAVAAGGLTPALASAASPGETAVSAAAQANQYLFVLFWKEDDAATQAARQALAVALARRPGTASVTVRVTDPVEKPLVERFGLSRSPMPLMLALAPNGAVTAAAPLKVTEQDVARAFVSPGQAACLQAVQARKLVLLCVQPAGGSAVLPEGVLAFQADPRFGPATAVVSLRADDAAESGFVKALQIDPRTAAPVTVLVSPPGRVLGSFPGAVSKKQLVERVTAPQGGCCPGGKCGPGGCCAGGKCGSNP